MRVARDSCSFDGFFVYPEELRESEALAAQLRDIAAAPELTAKIALAGRTHAMKTYSLEEVGARLEAAIEKSLRHWQS